MTIVLGRRIKDVLSLAKPNCIARKFKFALPVGLETSKKERMKSLKARNVTWCNKNKKGRYSMQTFSSFWYVNVFLSGTKLDVRTLNHFCHLETSPFQSTCKLLKTQESMTTAYLLSEVGVIWFTTSDCVCVTVCFNYRHSFSFEVSGQPQSKPLFTGNICVLHFPWVLVAV